MNNGTCVDLVHDYRCQCLPGFTGRTCQHDLRKCNNTLCRNYGSCYLGYDGYAQCNCNAIYTGLFCETRKEKIYIFRLFSIIFLIFFFYRCSSMFSKSMHEWRYMCSTRK